MEALTLGIIATVLAPLFVGAMLVWAIILRVSVPLPLIINVSAFTSQVQKLIMANNIDRAIKLCNAAKSESCDPPYANAVKALLARSNRPQEDRDIEHQAGVGKLNRLRADMIRRAVRTGVKTSAARIVALIPLLALAWQTWWALLVVVLCLLLVPLADRLARGGYTSVIKHVDEALTGLDTVHALLRTRGKVR